MNKKGNMQETLNKIAKLKGGEKLDFIKNLANDAKNIPVLLHLAENEKGYNKEYALQGLTRFDVAEALPIFKKLLKSKSKGEKILLHGTSDMVSDLVAEEIHTFFTKLFQNEKSYCLSVDNFEDFQRFLSLILGKASEKMRNIYRLLAENNDKFASFNFKSSINQHFNFYTFTKETKKKIFPQTLSLSIIRNPDQRLITLADELTQKYGENWLTAKMVASFFTEKAEVLFEKYSPLLLSKEKTYILDALALLYFNKKTEKHTAIAQWGNYYDERNDTSTYFSREIKENLDERWLEILTEIVPEKIALQTYFSLSAGVAAAYESYDQILQALLPKNFENQFIKEKLATYFLKREKAEKGASLYIDALNLLQVPITEAIIEKWIAYKPEAVSKYNIPIMLNNNTRWTDEQKLNFYKKLPANLVNQDAIKKLQNK
ncbi:hypothetical protein CGC48_06890 [Capnocytophaga cynodegmi]|uniref:Uncharacterized protein n=2 Tax=Capnocytophaga cynodegmi TaxID=28189 RepID=A0A250E9F0_9FLAO|nr:hypothetical protein CGC48_06890 [Capnocytophaga cynodegmi]